ncbi:MAG: hypothetical protein A4E53_00106 [Pelotomaculum sp. PtaB.Bin104]|nr:MAG: hypothetical protein A4E53_00106 [Pelotomaculum sp. PtaB.Bin104]
MEAAVIMCRCDLDAELERVIAQHEGKMIILLSVIKRRAKLITLF